MKIEKRWENNRSKMISYIVFVSSTGFVFSSIISISLSLLLAITKGTSLLTPVSILPYVFNASVVVVVFSTTSPIITLVKSLLEL